MPPESENPPLRTKAPPLAVLILLALSLVGFAAASGVPPNGNALGSGQWIGAYEQGPWPKTGISASRLPLLRRDFKVSKSVERATLFICGLGQYEARINGNAVTTSVLNPAWSDYRRRIYFDSYDVTKDIHLGRNAIGVMLGNGMYNVQETKGRYTKWSGPFRQPRLIARLLLTYRDGTQQSIVSNAEWKASSGPITFSSIYGGEDYDARLGQQGWDLPSFQDSGWIPVAIVESPGGKLVPSLSPPIKLFDRYLPVKIIHPQPGLAIYDLGQNFAGWPEISVTGARGSRVTLRAGELLDSNGLVTQRSANASSAAANLFVYVLKGTGIEHWHPRFSYYGFRYVQVESRADQPFVVQQLEGRALHADVKMDGRFTSSDLLLNRIHTLIDRAMLSNMMSVLTDCPQREKLGWLEQTHLAGAALIYNYGLKNLYAKIADDMQDAQLPDGLVPDIAPEYTVFENGFRDSPEWGSADILSTWTAYQFYGDPTPLRLHYASMQKYLAYLRGKTQDHLLSYGLGDWYDIGPAAPGESQLTSKGLTATAIYYQSLTDMVVISKILGRGEDAAAYQAEAMGVKKAFNERFFHRQSDRYDTGSQTANAMPLVVGLVPEGRQAAVLANLVADIRSHSNHVTAGDIGFHYVVRALTDYGRSDVMYDMLSRTDRPSYGDQLAHGATTLTEAWDANPNSSQNHFMLGHAEEWFYRGLAGIDFDRSRGPRETIVIRPAIVGSVRSVSASFDSSLGKIVSEWQRDGDTLKLEIDIPAGSSSKLELPFPYVKAVEINGHPLPPTRQDGEPAMRARGRWVPLASGANRIVATRDASRQRN